jgi:SAM-dependent methyltransferase
MKRPKILGDRLGAKLDALIRGPGEERASDWYDRMFSRAPHYHEPYNSSGYYFLWAVIADRLRRDCVGRVLDIGCGTGQLADLLFDQGIEEYVGLDFSPTAVAHAQQMAPRGRYVIGDARYADVYATADYDVLICTEVLEHIEEDLLVVSLFRPTTRCIFSVPNYDSAAHVRFFADSSAVSERYGPYFTALDVAAFPTVGSEKNRVFLAEGVRNDITMERSRPILPSQAVSSASAPAQRCVIRS